MEKLENCNVINGKTPIDNIAMQFHGATLSVIASLSVFDLPFGTVGGFFVCTLAVALFTCRINKIRINNEVSRDKNTWPIIIDLQVVHLFSVDYIENANFHNWDFSQIVRFYFLRANNGNIHLRVHLWQLNGYNDSDSVVLFRVYSGEQRVSASFNWAVEIEVTL